jgi:hypothetical protein
MIMMRLLVGVQSTKVAVRTAIKLNPDHALPFPCS